MTIAEAMYSRVPEDEIGSLRSNTSRGFKLSTALLGGSCLLVLGVIYASGHQPQMASAVDPTSLFGLSASSRAAMMPKAVPNLRARRSAKVGALQDAVLGDRYGRALLELSVSENKLEENHQALEALRIALEQVPELKKQLANPIIPADEKIKLIEKAGVPAGKDTTPQKFIRLMIDEGRMGSILEALNAFDKLYCDQGGTVVATVTAAGPMDEEEELAMAKKVQELAKCKSVKIKKIVDPELIGGFILEFGSKLIDNSISGQLKRMERELANAA